MQRNHRISSAAAIVLLSFGAGWTQTITAQELLRGSSEAGAPTGSELCAMIPDSPNLTFAFPPEAGATGCEKLYLWPGQSVRQQFVVDRHLLPTVARDIAERMRTTDGQSCQSSGAAITSLGDGNGHESLRTCFGQTQYVFSFTYGCYLVSGLAAPENAAMYREMAAAVDRQLKVFPECPGASVSPTIDAGLACETGQLNATGQLLCTATVINERSDAEIVYEWLVDGRVVGVIGDLLTLNDLTVGNHEVSVRARDTNNNLTSPLQSASVTRSAEATQSAGSGGGFVPSVGSSAGASPPVLATPFEEDDGGVSLPVVVGGAVAAAAALVGLARIRRRESRPTGTPPRPTDRPEAVFAQSPGGQSAQRPSVTNPPPRPTPAPPPQPTTRPQDTDNPTLVVRLRVSPGFKNKKAGEANAQIWGDGVDLAFAGFDYDVTPSWSVTWTKVNYVLVLGAQRQRQLQRTNDPQLKYFDQLFDAGNPPNVGATTSLGGKPLGVVIREDNWTRQDVTATVRLEVIANLTRAGHPPRNGYTPSTVSGSTLEKSVHVIAAQPELSLKVARLSRRALLSNGTVAKLPKPYASAKIADADGTFPLAIKPRLRLFGEDYVGGTTIVPAGAGAASLPSLRVCAKDTESWETFFKTDRVDGTDPMLQEHLALVCKFHVNDADMTRLADRPVSAVYSVSPTGRGARDQQRDNWWDYMAFEHYQACLRNKLLIEACTPSSPVQILLRPSQLEIKADPKQLPKANDQSKALFTSKITATVKSASGKEIDGTDKAWISSYDPARKTWKLVCNYKNLAPALASVPKFKPIEVTIISVDNQGRLEFEIGATEPGLQARIPTELDYDHFERHWDAERFVLYGQRSELHVVCKADLVDIADVTIAINDQPVAAAYCWDYPVFELTGGNKATAVNGAEGLRTELRKSHGDKPMRITDTDSLPHLWGGPVPGAVFIIGQGDTGHCGIVGSDGKVRHFLQAGTLAKDVNQNIGKDLGDGITINPVKLTRRWGHLLSEPERLKPKAGQGVPLNPYQINEMVKVAEAGNAPKAFETPAVYSDSLTGFLRNNAASKNYSVAQRVEIWLPSGATMPPVAPTIPETPEPPSTPLPQGSRGARGGVGQAPE